MHDDYWLGEAAAGLSPLGWRAAGHLGEVAGSWTHAGYSFAVDFLAGQNLVLAGQNLAVALSSVDRVAVCLALCGYVHQCLDAGNQG